MGGSEGSRLIWMAPNLSFSSPGSLRYWEPLFREMQRVFPGILYLAAGGVCPRYKETFNVRSVGWSVRVATVGSKSGHYDRGFTLLSPAVGFELLRLKPDVVVTPEFNLWTIIAALLKPIGRWGLVVLFEGSSPSSDFLDSRLRLAVRRWVAGKADAFITNSNAGVRYLTRHLHAREERVRRIVHETASADTLLGGPSPAPPIHAGRRPRFLYAGQLISRKGVNHLLDAWSKLRGQRPSKGSLWVVGDGPLKPELMRQAGALGLSEVHFVGGVDYGSIGSWYGGCDVLVLPTLEDTWGMVVLEAMALGKPVLCSVRAGASELVAGGVNGFTFKPEDSGRLADLMLEFIDKPRLAVEFGLKSAEAMSAYTHAKAADAIRDLINAVAYNRQTGSG